MCGPRWAIRLAMIVELSPRVEYLISVYLYDLYQFMTVDASEDAKNRLLNSASAALTAILTENGVATGYSQALDDIAKEILQ